MKKINYFLYSFIFFILIFSSNVFALELKNSEVISENNYYEFKENSSNINDSNKIMNIYSASSNNVFDSIINEIIEQGTKNVDANLKYDYTVKMNTRYFNVYKYRVSESFADELSLKIYERPELFYSAGIFYRTTTDGYIYDFIVLYYMNQNQINSELEKINKETEKFLKGCDSSWTNLEKVLYTHDYICKLVNYNNKSAASDLEIIKSANPDITKINWSSHRLNGALVDKLPVCDGYSRTMIYLLNKLGISASIVTSDSMKHSWNMVNLNNQYYHVDSTWDDMNCDGRAFYEYFLVSDKEMLNRGHRDYSAYNLAISTKYDGTQVWNKTVSFLNYYKDYWYYLNIFNKDDNPEMYTSEIVLNKVDLNTNKYVFSKNIKNLKFQNKINFSPCLTTDGKYLYFNAMDKIYSMNFNGENISEYLKIVNNERLYCLMYWDSVLYYDTLKYIAPEFYIKYNNYIPVQKIELSKNELTLGLNSPTYTLKANIKPNNATNKTIKWSSSNSNIVNVSNEGKLTAYKEGTAVITAKCDNCVAKCTVVVKKQITNLPFKDVKKSDWFYNAVEYTYKNNIISGYDKTTFAPNDKITRAMMVTILYRMEGSPNNNGKSKFSDVPTNEWYSKAIKWASEKGIVNGYGGTNNFGPNDNIIRQDLAGILRNYAKYKKKNINVLANLTNFKDYKKVENYAVTSMKWAVGNGVITGNSDGTLNPKGNATRAEAAAMIQKYCNNVGR